MHSQLLLLWNISSLYTLYQRDAQLRGFVCFFICDVYMRVFGKMKGYLEWYHRKGRAFL